MHLIHPISSRFDCRRCGFDFELPWRIANNNFLDAALRLFSSIIMSFVRFYYKQIRLICLAIAFLTSIYTCNKSTIVTMSSYSRCPGDRRCNYECWCWNWYDFCFTSSSAVSSIIISYQDEEFRDFVPGSVRTATEFSCSGTFFFSHPKSVCTLRPSTLGTPHSNVFFASLSTRRKKRRTHREILLKFKKEIYKSPYFSFYSLSAVCTVQYCTVLYCTVLYCTVLYCTVLLCTLCTAESTGMI